MGEQLTERIVTAAEKGDLDGVRAALADGASADAMGPNSGALHVAAFGGFSEVVDALLKAGANPNVADKQSFYPLQLAASKGHADVMRLLIDGGAGVEKATKFGGTALQVAAASNFPMAVRVLMEAKANLEAKDQGGNTALATAMSLGNVGIAQLLIEQGADIHAGNDAEETVLLKLARALKKMQVRKGTFTGELNGNQTIFHLHHGHLTFKQDDELRSLPWAEQRKLNAESLDLKRHVQYLDACEFLLELAGQTGKINDRDQEGIDLLTLVAHTGEPMLITGIAELGGKIGLPSKSGFTALHFVAGSSRLDGLEVFCGLFPDADFNAQDDFGWTPLHYLADIGGPKEMLHLLLAMGAEKDIQSTKERGQLAAGVTPKEVALHWKDNAIADLLG